MIGAARALDRCAQLARLSSLPGGIERVTLSPEHAAANALVAGWLRDAGLDARQDPAGNLIGRREGRTAGLPALVLGSHLDTVPDAGAFDGMLGVLLAIEVADRLRGADLPFALEVVGFTDEEGTRFGTALAGSRAFAGQWDPAWEDRVDGDGLTLRVAAAAFGLDPDRIADAARRPDELVGYLEVHIEQGPHLEDAGRALAAVSGIASARRFELTVTGQAGHAGGTPYGRRRDALVGASEIVLAVERIARETGAIGTVGRMAVEPGGVNVVPGVARFSLDLRAESDARRDEVWQRVEESAREVCDRRGLAWAAAETYRADAAICDARLRSAVEAGIRATGDPAPLVLWSRAGHDGLAVSAVTPFAMLFLRCGNGGVSHAPEETVAAADVAVALEAFEAAVRAVAAG